MSAGLPRNQLVLGVASCGHLFLVNESVALTEQGEISAYPQFKPTQPRGDSADDQPGVDVCGAVTGWGVFSISGGWLRANSWMGTAYLFRAFITDMMNAVKRSVLCGGVPCQRLADGLCDQPYLYNVTSQVIVSFDNAKSFKTKVQLSKRKRAPSTSRRFM
jgi:chitinase